MNRREMMDGLGAEFGLTAAETERAIREASERKFFGLPAKRQKDPDLISTRELGERLGWPTWKVYRKVRAMGIGEKIGRIWYVSKREIRDEYPKLFRQVESSGYEDV